MSWNSFDARFKLHGDRAGQYAIRINPQYWVCFTWHKGHAYEVEIADLSLKLKYYDWNDTYSPWRNIKRGNINLSQN